MLVLLAAMYHVYMDGSTPNNSEPIWGNYVEIDDKIMRCYGSTHNTFVYLHQKIILIIIKRI